MARPASKSIDYVIATETMKVCPKCKMEIVYPGPRCSCKCGWSGRGGEVKTKIVEYKVKAYKSVIYA